MIVAQYLASLPPGRPLTQYQAQEMPLGSLPHVNGAVPGIASSIPYPVSDSPIQYEGLGTTDVACVYCRRHPADPAWRPFCSHRCKMADLGRWLGGGYTIPVADVPDVPGDDDDPGH